MKLPDDKLTYKRVGDKAIEISWPDNVQDILINRHNVALAIEEHFKNEVLVNEGYRTILLLFKDEIKNPDQQIQELKQIITSAATDQIFTPKKWRIPVLYDQDSADLLAISKQTLLTFETIKRKHQEAIYTVEFIGFLPGFPYLSGLPEILNIPRRETPNPSIQAGSVAIAAGQCGVYPRQSPGGWYVLGRSPLEFFEVHREQPNLLSIGDCVCFYDIDRQEFDRIKSESSNLKTFQDG